MTHKIHRPRRHEEADRQEATVEFLILSGFDVYEIGKKGGVFIGKDGKPRRNQTPGVADIIAVRGEEMLFIEIKSADGVVSPKQKHFLESVRRVRISRSMVAKHWTEVRDFLELPPFCAEPEIEITALPGEE